MNFAQRLWDNPSLVGLSSLQKEEQLLTFIQKNAAILQPTLASSAYFPGIPWPQVMELLKHSIFQLASEDLGSLYDTILKHHMDLSFVKEIEAIPGELPTMREQIGQYLRKFSDKASSRRELSGPLLGISTGIIDKYVTQSLERKKYIGIELRNVQRLKLNGKQIANFVKFSMLLRPAIYYHAPDDSAITNITPNYAQMVTEKTLKALKFIPKSLIRSGINSFFSFQQYPHIESTARLAAVFTLRCSTLKSGITVERGAESSDKSWFSVARKNYRHHGFDLDMLFELQDIATKNGW